MKRLLALFRRRPDPVLLLKQSIRELEDGVPALNDNLASIKGQVGLVEKELERLRAKRAELVEKAGEARSRGRADVAANYDHTQAEVEAEIARQERALRVTEATFELAREHKRAFMAGKEELIQAAKASLSAVRQAEWQRRVACALRAFEVNDRRAHEDELAAVSRFKAEAAASEDELREVLERLVAGAGASPEALMLGLGAAREEVASLERRLEETREWLRACELRLERLQA